MTTEYGKDRIKQAFEKAHETQTSAVMPYFTLGYPNMETSADVIRAIAPYSNLLELGVAFSDPIADGSTIQRSTQVALENGATLKDAFATIAQLRSEGIDTPAMLMGYYNPIMAYGIERYVAKAKEVGIDGFIVPDLPPEEAEEFEAAVQAQGLSLINFLAPTSSQARIKHVTSMSDGFIYMVSVTGITGARSQIREGLQEFVEFAKAESHVPVAVGFGISGPEQAAKIGQYADGVILGSAVIDAFDAGGVEGVEKFVASLKDAVQKA